MHHIGGVEKLETPEELIDEELDVVVGQGLRRLDDTAQVRLHKLAYDVEVTEPVPMQGLEDGLQVNDILVPQQPEEADFAQSPLCVHGMLEGVANLLDRHPLPLLDSRLPSLVPCRADDTVPGEEERPRRTKRANTGGGER